MARPVGRPPDNLAAQLRAWYLSTTTTDSDRAFLAGQISAWDMEVAARAPEEPKKRKAKNGEQPEIPLREPESDEPRF
jgi:hypothetical protein